MTTENKGIEIGQSETKQDDIHGPSVEPGHSVHQKRKRANSDSQLSLKESVAKKQRLNTLTAHVTDTEKSFADLPYEMFHIILQYVGTSDLLNCRLVNCQWNEISTQIIRVRDDITIHFEMYGVFFQKIVHQHREKLFDSTSRMGTRTLADIVNCIRDSDQFPFTNYTFQVFADYRNSAMRDFLSVFGKEIRSFGIHVLCMEEISKTLQKLVFEEAPNLKILEIRSHYHGENPSYVRRLVESTNQLQLPKLEVLRMNHVSPKIFEAVMMSSANLKSISFGGSLNTEDFQILQRAGKLHCLKDVDLVVGQGIIARWLECGPLQLQSLNLEFATLSDNQQLMLSVTKAVHQLLQSIKSTLQSFTTEPLGLLTGLVLPKFEKLKRLRLQPSFRNISRGHRYPLLPPSIELNDAFPNLKELDIQFGFNWLDPTLRQSLKTLPTLETLRIKDGDRNDIEGLMKLTPNVKTLVIEGDSFVWYERSGSLVDLQAISTYLPKLENFGWELKTGTKDISRIPHMHHFDAAVTGLPADLCRKLAEEFRNKDKLSAAEVAKYRSKKSQTSILDLKELKNFLVKLTVLDEWAPDMDDFVYESDGELGFEPECNSEITKVSKFLGFDLMPNLKFFVHSFHREG